MVNHSVEQFGWSKDESNLALQQSSRDLTLLLAICRETLCVLNRAGSIAIEPTSNIQAIVGLLALMQPSGEGLIGPPGKPISPAVCLSMLQWLGATTDQPVDADQCAQLCADLGLSLANFGGVPGCLRRIAGGVVARLKDYTHILEEMGYHLRLKHRLSSFCQPVAEVEPVMHPLFGRRLTLPATMDDFAIAA